MMPLVSVLIPAFNVEDYIEEAVESITNQTYKNLEIIIVDDFSTDSTYHKISQLKSKDNRIKIFRNSENFKISKTLNFAFSVCTGKYIVRMDGDDISEKNRIEKKIIYLEKNKQIDLVGCSVNSINSSGKQIGSRKFSSSQKNLDKNLRFITPVLHIWAARRHVYESINGYREELNGAEDYDFLLRMKSSGFIYSNLEDYYGYSVRIGRTGNTNHNLGLKQIKLHQYIYALYKERLRSTDNSDSLNINALNKYIKSYGISNYLYNLSCKFLIQSLENKNEKKYFQMVINLIKSSISPHQVIFISSRIYTRLINKIYK